MNTRNILSTFICVSLVGAAVFQNQPATAARTSLESMLDFTQFPVVGTSATVSPQVVLNVSRDHQLYYKAYNDYTDLDGDGTLDTTYKHSIDYYGYFDSRKCYTYSTTDQRFNPASISADKYCSNAWSGNFLNWATMTRMDAVRKLLFGGSRSTDTGSATVLERAHLASDAHSFAKFYNGNDIARLTPFNPPTSGSMGTVRFAAPIAVRPYSRHTTNTPGFSGAPFNAAPHTTPLCVPLDGANGGNVLVDFNQGDQVVLSLPNNPSVYMTGGVFDTTRVQTTLQDTDSNPLTPPVPVRTGNCPNLPAWPDGRYLRVEIDPRSYEGAETTNDEWTIGNLSNQGISFCNLSFASGNNVDSVADTNPPLVRVARGNFELWGANERRQCHWQDEAQDLQGGFFAAFRSNGNRAFFSGLNSSAENPRRSAGGDGNVYQPRHLGSGNGVTSSTNANGQFVVRVAACVNGLIGSERCKSYPSGNFKPIGLLQQYGDDGDLRFALFTGTWDKNVSGGVLRKPMGDMRDEINVTTNGTFTSTNGLVRQLSRMRVAGFRRDENGYNSNDACTFQRTGIGNGIADSVAEGACANWGNPFSEMFAESLRYLAGASATAAFNPGTAGKDNALGLAARTWTDPIDRNLYCSPLNVLNFNASVSSYDWNSIPTGGLAGAPSPASLTNTIATDEGLSGATFYGMTGPGATGAAGDRLCSIKNLTSLGDMVGICPEAPALEGSYRMAGLAWWAKTNRIRSDVSVPGTDRQSLKVTSYGIQLATNTPKIVVPMNGRTVTILPAYRLDRSSNGSGPFGGGAIVDFRVVYYDVANGRGKFYVNWEDSAFGGDYDQDMWGFIEYRVNGSQITVTTDAVSASTSNGQGFGYIISGTTQDGPHFHTGIYDFDFTDPTNVTVSAFGTPLNGVTGSRINASGGCTNCILTMPPTSVTYTQSTSNSATLLKEPLWYAAKWGGFTDRNNNDKPDLQDEWDSVNVAGDPIPDGQPDTYFLVTNPGALEDSLAKVFQSILSKTSSGTAAAVVANSSRGFGALYQALFEARRTDGAGREARWMGDLQGLFIDSAGFLREDVDGDKRLDNYATDAVIQFFFDSQVQPPRTRYKRLANISGNDEEFEAGPIGPDGLPPGTIFELEDLKTLWNARNSLADIPDASINSQRSYAATASGGRHMLTWIDEDRDGNVSPAERKSFTWDANGFGGSNYYFLNSDDPTEAQKIVAWTRGEEVAGLRTRRINYAGGSGAAKTMRLADIVNSTPVAVGSPAESFNLLYGDDSYADFARGLSPRRQVVLVGSNSGMLHAFHAGFFDSRNLQFARGAGTASQQPLGAELWAYVPGNALPHLRWYTDPDYTHVFTVDGSPYVFDAKVFSSRGGWGTIAAVNFRTGGGNISVDSDDFDGVGASNADGDADDDISSRAATVLLDITNPNAPPRVLAEIQADDGYQLGRPGAVVINSSGENRWFLVVPSGPNKELNAGRMVSDRPLKLRVFDLQDLAVGNVSVLAELEADSLGDDSFGMDLVAADFDLDYSVEALYFGSNRDVGGIEFEGSLYKVDTNESASPASWRIKLLHDTDRPVSIMPTVALDRAGERFVYAGTGRLFSPLDAGSTSVQRIYGVKDRSLSPASPSSLPVSGLVDTTNVVVAPDGTVGGVPFEQYLASIASANGFYRNLDGPTASGGAERVVSNQAVSSSLLVTTSYIPSTDLCANLGSGRLYVLNYQSGTASPGMAGVTGGTGGGGGIPTTFNLGPGVPSAPTLSFGQGENAGTIQACIQTSTGAIVCQDLGAETLLRPGETSWRQPSETN